MAKTKTKKSVGDRRALLEESIKAYAAEKADADQTVAEERGSGVPAGSVNFSMRLPTDLAVKMRAAAGKENLPTSAWLRRTIITALEKSASDPCTDEHIERVVRRILAENQTQ